MVPVQSFAESKKCNNSFSSLVTKLWNSGEYKAKTWQEVKVLNPRPKYVFIQDPAPGTLEQFSDMGYVQDYRNRNKGKVHWILEPKLLNEQELEIDLLKTVSGQRDLFISHFGNPVGRLNPSNREKYFSDFPQQDHILSKKTLQDVHVGWHSFVVIDGENFIRLGGAGHTILGARMSASSAGEIKIEVDQATGKKIVAAFNPRSDTYRPMPAELLPAVEAMWRQGIFPTKLKILEWDKRTHLLELESKP
jgi:hypothetical protein